MYEWFEHAACDTSNAHLNESCHENIKYEKAWRQLHKLVKALWAENSWGKLVSELFKDHISIYLDLHWVW